MIVAIDGPSGAGKSTVAKSVADKLGFACLDTGAMYRCVALAALREGTSLDDAQSLGELARSIEISFGAASQSKCVFLNGEDVTNAIRTGEIDKAVTPVSACSCVREAMVFQQRKIGETGNYVLEGRDIGTVVFPDADVKVFLTATDEERAHRRVRQNADRGTGSIDFDEVFADLKRRDECDSKRADSPLRAADDAVLLDSTSLYIEDVIDKICALARSAAETESANN